MLSFDGERTCDPLVVTASRGAVAERRATQEAGDTDIETETETNTEDNDFEQTKIYNFEHVKFYSEGGCRDACIDGMFLGCECTREHALDACVTVPTFPGASRGVPAHPNGGPVVRAGTDAALRVARLLVGLRNACG